MKSNRLLFLLQPLEHRIKGSESSSLEDLLKTPCEWDYKENLQSDDTPHSSGTLGQQAAMGKLDYLIDRVKSYMGGGKMIITPTASDGMRSNYTLDSLTNHNKPNAESSNMAEQLAHICSPDGGTSRLSPQFTEEMMGFPFLWTALPFLSTNGDKKHSRPMATQ
jgi:hypothetical protein